MSANQSTTPAFLTLPTEIRLQICSYLLPSSPTKTLSVRHYLTSSSTLHSKTRAKYHIVTPIQRRYIETTYHILPSEEQPPSSTINTHRINITPSSSASLSSQCPQIMLTCRKIYHETTHLLYSTNTFDFGLDLEAIGPFLSDLTPHTRSLIPEIRVRKRGPSPFIQSDNTSWSKMCSALSAVPNLGTLTIVVEARRPAGVWEGPQELSAADFRLLSGIRHESLAWVKELGMVKGVAEVRVTPEVRESSVPNCTEGILFAAMSASFHGGFMRFLQEDFGMPVRIC